MSMQDSPITDTRDLLGAIPTLMGFRPEHSLVILGIMPGGLLGPIARVDFPDDRAEAAALLGKLCPQLSGFGVSHVITVLYTRHVDPEHAATVCAVLEALWATTEATGLAPLAAWHVGPTLYRALPTTPTDPVTDRSGLVDDLYSGRVLAELVAEGLPVATGTREDLFACLTPAADVHRASIGALAERCRLEMLSGKRHLEAGFLTWLDEVERARTTPDAVHELTPDAAALLLACLRVDDFRDAVMVDSMPGGESACRALLTDAPGAKQLLSEVLERVFTGSLDRPDPATVGGTRRVLEALVRQAPAGLASNPLAVLAFLAWWQDETVLAGEAAQRAAEDEGGSTLAVLVTQALGIGLRPGWTGAGQPQR